MRAVEDFLLESGRRFMQAHMGNTLCVTAFRREEDPRVHKLVYGFRLRESEKLFT